MAQPATSYVPQTDNAAASRKMRTVQRTDGANTVEEYLNSASEAHLPTYVTSGYNAAMSVGDSHVLEIMAGASLRVGIRRIVVQQQAAASATARPQINITRLTTAGTGGTGVGIFALDPADSAAGATGMQTPTVKGTESSELLASFGLIHATFATVGINPVLDIDFTKPGMKSLWIAAGTSNGIAIKNVSTDANCKLLVTVWFVESSWT